MKRLISVALALVMIFALTVSVAAKESPTAKDYYYITTSTEPEDGSLGTAATDKPKVLKTSGDQVTLTATETEGFFTLWIIDGDYELVDGDEESPELTIIPHSDIHAIASFSVDEDYLTMTVSVVGDGKASVDPVKIKKGSDGTATFIAEDGADTFTHWTLDCKYDIVEGDLNSRKLVIRPYTDVHGTAYFVGSTPDSSSSKSISSSGGSDSPSSPKTGDPLWIVIGMAVLALSAGALAVKKIKE